ncbi:hypothetical protein D777_02414 [Marinobacter nitratireducens]|uniref:Uncharacterized protein n=1 Tax=Marinobacter nitratireducens TaxID=1137280 RepID=A0A072MZP5_9GAMM|nr:hypothetical protein D777_02414 [Marinobacter nitratireducens]
MEKEGRRKVLSTLMLMAMITLSLFKIQMRESFGTKWIILMKFRYV